MSSHLNFFFPISIILFPLTSVSCFAIPYNLLIDVLRAPGPIGHQHPGGCHDNPLVLGGGWAILTLQAAEPVLIYLPNFVTQTIPPLLVFTCNQCGFIVRSGVTFRDTSRFFFQDTEQILLEQLERFYCKYQPGDQMYSGCCEWVEVTGERASIGDGKIMGTTRCSPHGKPGHLMGCIGCKVAGWLDG